jgi:hypothetical protein
MFIAPFAKRENIPRSKENIHDAVYIRSRVCQKTKKLQSDADQGDMRSVLLSPPEMLVQKKSTLVLYDTGCTLYE